MEGIGRECGMATKVPLCNTLSKYPASSLAAAENGGILTCP